jgi:hypothetical protein
MSCALLHCRDMHGSGGRKQAHSPHADELMLPAGADMRGPQGTLPNAPPMQYPLGAQGMTSSAAFSSKPGDTPAVKEHQAGGAMDCLHTYACLCMSAGTVCVCGLTSWRVTNLLP